MRYEYEPAGNIVTLSDGAARAQWHRNQEAGTERAYAYDTLSRLVRAESRQKVPSGRRRGPLPAREVDGIAGSAWVPYAERYAYDDGDNLISTVREGSLSGDGWTRTTTVSGRSNRGVTSAAGGGKSPARAEVSDPHEAFQAGGLLRELEDGRALRWHADGQLAGVGSADGGAEEEEYVYADPGARVRKRTVMSGAPVRLTTYAGCCEWRQRAEGGRLPDAESVIAEAGGMRVIRMREGGKESWLVRWSWEDHLGSVSGETDEAGEVTSREEYAPYGESLGGDEEAGLSRRTRRYSGKERDATGLYYYGWRYYQPEAGRWLSADTGGLVDGLNLFLFCRCNPVSYFDQQGRFSMLFKHELKKIIKSSIKTVDQALTGISEDKPEVSKVMDAFFGDSSEAQKLRWKDDLEKVKTWLNKIDLDRNLSAIEYTSNTIAQIEKNEFKKFNVYDSALSRLEKDRGFWGEKEYAKQLSEKNESYKEQRNSKYLQIDESNWNKAKAKGGVDFLVKTMIHEFSHAAIHTEDYAYGSILNGEDISALLELPEGKLKISSQLFAYTEKSKEPGDMNFKEMAYNNADSFAYATTLLAYSSSKQSTRREKFNNLVGSRK